MAGPEMRKEGVKGMKIKEKLSKKFEEVKEGKWKEGVFIQPAFHFCFPSNLNSFHSMLFVPPPLPDHAGVSSIRLLVE